MPDASHACHGSTTAWANIHVPRKASCTNQICALQCIAMALHDKTHTHASYHKRGRAQYKTWCSKYKTKPTFAIATHGPVAPISNRSNAFDQRKNVCMPCRKPQAAAYMDCSGVCCSTGFVAQQLSQRLSQMKTLPDTFPVGLAVHSCTAHTHTYIHVQRPACKSAACMVHKNHPHVFKQLGSRWWRACDSCLSVRRSFCWQVVLFGQCSPRSPHVRHQGHQGHQDVATRVH